MLRKKGLRLFPLLLLSFSLLLVSCEEEEEEQPETPPIDRGHTEVDRMQLIFRRIVGSTRVVEDTAEVNLSTGQVDSLVIARLNSSNATIVYEGEIRFFSNGNEVTGLINDKDFDYIVCYRDFQTQQLLLTSRSLDSEGRTLGLITEWRTVSGSGGQGESIRVTLNYQPLTKDGLCDAGIRIFEYDLPYRFN